MAVLKTSVLDAKPSHVFGLPLTTVQQIWLCMLLPSAVNCAVYILDLATCVALVFQHFRDDLYLFGGLTLLLLYAPSMVFFEITVSDPQLWDEHSGCKDNARWFFLRVVQFLIFPIWPIYRFAKQLFWSIEAWVKEDPYREEALVIADKTSRTELFLFLQAFLQCATQALLQLYIILYQYGLDVRISANQVLVVLLSLVILALTTTSFHRFESQKTAGRKKPWAPQPKMEQTSPVNVEEGDEPTNIQEDSMLPPSPKLASADFTAIDEEMNPTTLNQPRGNLEASPSIRPPRRVISVPEMPAPPRPNGVDTRCLSSPSDSSAPPPPVSVPDLPAPPPPVSMPDLPAPPPPVSMPDLSAPPPPVPDLPAPPPPVSVPDLPAPPPPVSVPDLPAPPPPVSVQDLPAPSQLNTVETWYLTLLPEYHAPPRPGSVVPSRSLLLPHRKTYLKGLQEDDPLGKVVGFMWWFCHLLSRTLAIATLAHFYLPAALGLCLAHYLAMLAYLLHHPNRTVTTVLLNIGLAFIFLFSIIEYKFKFKRVIAFYMFYFGLSILENVLMTVAWYCFMEWEGYWYKYIFATIFVSCIISMLAMGTYLTMLKPKQKIFYLNQ